MKNVLRFILLASILYPQDIFAKPIEEKNYNAVRLNHGDKILLRYSLNSYTIYAARCNEMVNGNQKSSYIILYPGEPIELKDESGNILILYSLPCN